MSTYNIYCDESCHLPKDESKVMLLGSIWCPTEKAREITLRIREIKAKHGLKPFWEIKWTKVSDSKIGFYLDLVDYFFDYEDLHFRALIIPDKTKLRHADFGQDHDEWYYKMFFPLIKTILDPQHKYFIYIDIKDTQGAEKLRKLHEVLQNKFYDFDRKIVANIQTIRSHESTPTQIADFIMGAIGYLNRGFADDEKKSAAKRQVVERIRQRSRKSLTKSTLLRENKLNLFFWQAQEQ